jgi:hypothetical protein
MCSRREWLYFYIENNAYNNCFILRFAPTIMEKQEEFSMRKTVGDAIDTVLDGEPATMVKLAFLEGLVLGAAARGFEAPAIAALPALVDLTHGNITSNWPARAAFYGVYCAGVAVSYVDKIYSAIAQSIDLLK